jgi:hypothetical protein
MPIFLQEGMPGAEGSPMAPVSERTAPAGVRGRVRALTRSGAALVATLIGCGLLVAGPVAAPAFAEQTFTANGTYTVPDGVTMVRVVAKGAGGGGGGASSGGNGAMVTTYQPVTPGQVLAVTIGIAGRTGSNGGAGGIGEGRGGNSGSASGGGGGGSTSVLSGTTIQIIAGGGGGGSASNSLKYGGSGAVIDASPVQTAACNSPIANLCYPGGRGLAQGAVGGAGASGDYTAGPPSINARGGNGGDWRSDGSTGSNGNGGNGSGTGGGGGAGAGGGGGGGAGGTAGGGAGASRVSTNVSGVATYSGGGGAGGPTGQDGANGSVVISPPAPDTLTWATPTLSYGGSGLVTATPVSGLALTLASTTPSVCTVGAPTTSTSTTVTAVTAGTCTIRATTPGDTTYAAGVEDRSFTIAKIDQTIAAASTPTLTVGGGTGVLSVSRPSTSAVAFTSATTSVCTVGAPSTATSTTVTPVTAGNCTVRANAAADTNYNAAMQTDLVLTVGKGAQTVSFTSTAPSVTVGGPSYTPTVTGGGSGNPVVLTIDAPSAGVCAIDGFNAVTFTDVGSCVINADQVGNADYHAASRMQQTVTPGRSAQSDTFTSAAPAATVGGPPYTPTATGGGSGNAVVFTIDVASTGGCAIDGSHAVTFTGTGTCVVNADQTGSVTHDAAARVQQTVVVGKGAQTITFTSAEPSVVAGGPPYTPTATGGGSGNPVAFTIDAASTGGCAIDGSHAVTFTAGGVCVINADQAGNGDYEAGTRVQQAVTIEKITQTITFTSTAPAATVGGATYTPAVRAGRSRNPVTFGISSASTGGCSLGARDAISFTAAGTCVIDASQTGNATYSPARARQTVVVAPPAAPPTVSTVAPATGPAAGGTTVVVLGSGFATGPGLRVRFDGAAATDVVRVSAARLTVTTPAGSAGVVDVVVINPDGQSGTADAAFTYQAEVKGQTVAPGQHPRRLRDAGATPVNLSDARTAQGSPVTAKVSWAGAEGTGPCLVVKKGKQRAATVVLSGSCALRVTVVYTAPAVPGFAPYRGVVTYTTKAVRRPR